MNKKGGEPIPETITWFPVFIIIFVGVLFLLLITGALNAKNAISFKDKSSIVSENSLDYIDKTLQRELYALLEMPVEVNGVNKPVKQIISELAILSREVGLNNRAELKEELDKNKKLLEEKIPLFLGQDKQILITAGFLSFKIGDISKISSSVQEQIFISDIKIDVLLNSA